MPTVGSVAGVTLVIWPLDHDPRTSTPTRAHQIRPPRECRGLRSRRQRDRQALAGGPSGRQGPPGPTVDRPAPKRTSSPMAEPATVIPDRAPAIAATALRPEHVVRVFYADGEVRDVDLTPTLDSQPFAALRDPQTFVTHPRLCSFERGSRGGCWSSAERARLDAVAQLARGRARPHDGHRAASHDLSTEMLCVLDLSGLELPGLAAAGVERDEGRRGGFGPDQFALRAIRARGRQYRPADCAQTLLGQARPCLSDLRRKLLARTPESRVGSSGYRLWRARGR